MKPFKEDFHAKKNLELSQVKKNAFICELMIKFLHPNSNRCKRDNKNRVNNDFFKFPLFYLPKFRNNKVYKFLNFPVFDVIVQKVNGQKFQHYLCVIL